MNSEPISVSLPARFLSAGQCSAPGGWNGSAGEPDSVLLLIRDDGACPRALLLPPGGGRDPLPTGFDAGGPARWYWVRFRGVAGGISQVRLGLSPVSLSEAVFNRLSYGFHQLTRESEGLSGPSELCDYMLSVLLLTLRDEGKQAPRTAVAARMLEYIHSHCYERLTLPDLSRALGYSEDYLSRLLHEQVSCSFRQYIHRLRMRKAKKELLTGVRSIREIAEDCGYPNAKFFSASFLKYEGVAPTAFRNLYTAGPGREEP